MTWNSTWPNTSASVSANGATGQQNTSYVKDTLQIDHYFDSGNSAVDGLHRYVQLPKSDSGGTPTDPTLNANADGLYFAKQKTAAESPDNEDVQPFYLNAQTMQLLGIRACAVFNVDDTTLDAAQTLKYNHNVTSVVWKSQGVFQVTFPALPSNSYLFLSGGVPNSSGGLANSVVSSGVIAGNPVTDVKSTTHVDFKLIGTASNGGAKEAHQGWFVIFGG